MTHTIEHLSTDALIPYARNARTHDANQIAQIAGSIREFGFTNPVLIDKDNGIIAGHGRVMAAQKLGLESVPCIRLEHLSDTQKQAYILADNKLALNAGWDENLLKLELQELKQIDFDLETIGFSFDELDELLGNQNGIGADGSKYTHKVQSPVYEMTGKKPRINELFNKQKAQQLIDKIEQANLDNELKEFLNFAAYRHVVFDYHNIAEFYAHSTAEIQELMEESALVIIDFDKAIENGFVKMTKQINDEYLSAKGIIDDEE